MAIGFARLEYVQRSSGKNACAKSAYISREKIKFSGTKFAEAKEYDWSRKGEVPYHEILLPSHADSSFLKAEVLWNAAEVRENRSNSQTAMELVLALPDDLEVSLDDKIELAKSFNREHFVAKGLAAQIVVHPPDKKVQFNPEIGEIENLDHNWHVHVLVTTRYFTENGLELGEKARELMPVIRNGKVIFGPNWGELWTKHQNQFFESKGMSLRVDPNGVVAQNHLGPVRLRGRAFTLLENHHKQAELNIEKISDPEALLEAITERTNIFSREDIARLVNKFVGLKHAKGLVEAVISLKNVVQLFDRETKALPVNPKTGEQEEKYTTIEILLEEKKCLKLADSIQAKKASEVNVHDCLNKFSTNLNLEQKLAFQHLLQGKRLSCIEGHAGTGKSHLLVALKQAYENEGYIVRAFGPDSSTAHVLKEKGFDRADNIYHFLFSVNRFEKNQEFEKKQKQINQNHKTGFPLNKKAKNALEISKGKEIWLIDEATKLGNRPMLQILKFAEKYDAQVVFSGGVSQLLPVERGCLYDVFARRFGAQKLENIQRQKNADQQQISKKIAMGEMASALDQLIKTGSIIWVDSKKEELKATIQGYVEAAFGTSVEGYNDRTKAMEELVKKWVADREAFPASSSIIIASSNLEVRVLNELVRTYRKEKGEIEKKEFHYETESGGIFISQGDIIEFSSNNKELGVTNGMLGTLIKASLEEFKVQVKDANDQAREITVDPNKYASFKLGYATTYFRSQGRTIDRAYILHSIYTNKEMFYVGLTRHVRKAYMFVPKANFHFLSFLKAQAVGFGGSYGKYLTLNNYFKDKEIDSYLSDLIEQVSTPIPKFITSDYLSEDQLTKDKWDQEISDLKNSLSPIKRLKGYSLSLWNQASSKIESHFQNRKQEKREVEFFNPVFKKLEEKIRVHEESLYEPSAQEYRQAFILSLLGNQAVMQSPSGWEILPTSQQSLIKKYLEEASTAWRLFFKVERGSKDDPSVWTDWENACQKRNQAAFSLAKKVPQQAIIEILGKQCFETLSMQSNQYKETLKGAKIENPLAKDQLLQVEKAASISKMQILSSTQKDLLKDYHRKVLGTSALYSLIQAEKEMHQNPSHHLAWKSACKKRNEAANQLLKATPRHLLSTLLSQKSLDYIAEQSQRHEYLINRKNSPLLNLDTKLIENLELLLYRLFPEGPSRKGQGVLRFGSKGALAVTCRGEKMGSFFDFSEDKGGGPLQLIQKTLNFDVKEARNWAKVFLGEAQAIELPPSFQFKGKNIGNKSNWIAVKPNHPAPSLKSMPNCKLSRYCKEEARYAYKNEKGELLFYTLRLVDRKGRKSVLPLSYGIEQGKNQSPNWAFKAFQTTERSLYNLDLLYRHPNYKVVLVEGEKTADAANLLLNQHGMICLTWLGGASATNKTDWSPLRGRDVFIWPDNDQPGYKAARAICSELRKLGVGSLQVVDEQSLKNLFPLKWDLADPLPDGHKECLIRDLLLCAPEKGVRIAHLQFAVEKPNKEVELLRVNEILWRVEERLRPKLEGELADKPRDIQQKLMDETLKIYRQREKLHEAIQQEFGLDYNATERLTFLALIYRAKHGQEPGCEKLVELKINLTKISAHLPNFSTEKEGKNEKDFYLFAFDKAVSSALYDRTERFSLEKMTASFEKGFEELRGIFKLKSLVIESEVSHARNKNIDLSL